VVPPVSVGTAVRLVAQHCGHLGITVDEMAAALDGDRWAAASLEPRRAGSSTVSAPTPAS
jgi:hypothetical protein